MDVSAAAAGSGLAGMAGFAATHFALAVGLGLLGLPGLDQLAHPIVEAVGGALTV